MSNETRKRMTSRRFVFANLAEEHTCMYMISFRIEIQVSFCIFTRTCLANLHIVSIDIFQRDTYVWICKKRLEFLCGKRSYTYMCVIVWTAHIHVHLQTYVHCVQRDTYMRTCEKRLEYLCEKRFIYIHESLFSRIYVGRFWECIYIVSTETRTCEYTERNWNFYVKKDLYTYTKVFFHIYM